jgi:tetratricopeptide (TPR) repeat protein
MRLQRPDVPLGDSDELDGHVAMLEFCAHELGLQHPQTLAAAKNLGLAFWCAGYAEQAIGVLDKTIDCLTVTLGREHPTRVDLLCTLGEIMLEQRHLEQSGSIFREVVECCIRRSGPNHPSSLAAKGDLAAVLFELGEEEEAGGLEQEALESAQTHLGKTHPVTCVLTLNRALRYNNVGDPDSARRVLINELVWLLAEDPSSLDADQVAIRTMLAERLSWDTAAVC